MLHRRWLSAFALAALTALGTLPLACGSSDDTGGGVTPSDDGGADGPTTTNDGAAPGDDGAAGDDGASSNGDGAATCNALSAACTGDGDCCSHLCLGSKCVSSIATCGTAGTACGVNSDCCGGACVNGHCGTAACVSVGSACPAKGTNVCCTDTCINGKCAAIGAPTDGGTFTPTCTTAGNTCSGNGDCCSGLCGADKRCNIAGSYCIQNNDMCFHSADCCGGQCTAPNGQPVTATNPGLCGTPGGAVNCTAVDGILCAGTTPGCPGPCCSDLCIPYGPTGVLICQAAQGCRVEGDLCLKDTDCCGGEPQADGGIIGAGLVVCTKAPGATIGVCSTPSAGNGGGNTCRPPGDVCHYNGTGYLCSVSGSAADCCDVDGHPNKDLCQLDKLGVPRCLAYSGASDAGAGACRSTGETCSTASDCCNGVPCVPGPNGQLVCASTACIPTTGGCTSSADCCSGLTCVIPVGSGSGTCAGPTTPPPPTDGGTTGTDGGTTDGGTGTTDAGSTGGCASYGQSCASLACCTGYTCTTTATGSFCGLVK